MNKRPTTLFDKKTLKPEEIQNYWEEAYTRFETPQQEIDKFVSRLKKLGEDKWKRDIKIVDIFSGRCNGIRALEKLGFTNLEGVDISPNLLSHYQGEAKLYVADCRNLPFEDNSRDLIVVQGGLHHLPNLPDDLEKTLSEVQRVLKKNGLFVMVEPWKTPFLDLTHYLSEIKLIRKFFNKFDALATMIYYEAETYFQWLDAKQIILELLEKYFKAEFSQEKLGKLFFVGRVV